MAGWVVVDTWTFKNHGVGPCIAYTFSCRYSKEKEELDKVEARLAIIDAEKQIILAEQRAEEARIRNAKLEDIRQRRAAITLQRAWRQYKVLQQQSKKKKKGKRK